MPSRILRASEVRGHKTLYCIGSFGRRVNFAAQQNRALNLAWALHAGKIAAPGSEIAVVGAGVTGLTLAAGLMSYGCRVDLYEKGISALPRQGATLHRLVHPTINGWPTQRLEITTRLPFMEWHIGQCNDVSHQMRDEFVSLKHGGSRLLVNHAVTHITECATNLAMVKSKLEDDPTYRAVIITIGFGDEISYPTFESTPPYWNADTIETDRDNCKFDTYLVSGCGDGGLIDTLRIVHTKFDRGMLAFRMAAALDGSEVAGIIGSIEERLAKTPDANALEAEYARAAEMLATLPEYASINEELVESMKPFRQLVFLTDHKWSKPFSPNAAPIHKLLVAHAKLAGRVDYLHGAIENCENRYVIGGREFQPKDKVFPIVRHGADPKPVLRSFLSVGDIDDLEAKQLAFPELSDQLWSSPFPPMAGKPGYDPTSRTFIEDRRPLASDAIRVVDRFARVRSSLGGFIVTYPKVIPAMAPDILFGIFTESKLQPIAGAI